MLVIKFDNGLYFAGQQFMSPDIEYAALYHDEKAAKTVADRRIKDGRLYAYNISDGQGYDKPTSYKLVKIKLVPIDDES